MMTFEFLYKQYPNSGKEVLLVVYRSSEANVTPTTLSEPVKLVFCLYFEIQIEYFRFIFKMLCIRNHKNYMESHLN